MPSKNERVRIIVNFLGNMQEKMSEEDTKNINQLFGLKYNKIGINISK